METNRAAERMRAAGEKRKKYRRPPAEEQIKKLANKPCRVSWSDGSESRATLAELFFTEEAYNRYRGYKLAGAAYPVRVDIVDPLEDPKTAIFPEDPDGERELCRTISRDFTAALMQYVEGSKDPFRLADEATAVFNQQADEAQRELQRMADEADTAIRGTL